MNITHIRGVVVQDAYILRRDWIARADIPFFTLLNMVVLGYVSVFFADGADSDSGRILLIGVLLWDVLRMSQYLVTAYGLWNLWSRNLSNLFIAPLSLGEFIAGSTIAAAWKTLAVFVPVVLIAQLVFGFTVTMVGVGLVALAIVNLMMFGWGIGLCLLGLVFRYGLRVQAISWTAVFALQPLIGVYFPIEVLPDWAQTLAHCIPVTYVFDGIHNAIDGSGPTVGVVAAALPFNLLFLVLSVIAFRHMYYQSRRSGQFARNES